MITIFTVIAATVVINIQTCTHMNTNTLRMKYSYCTLYIEGFTLYKLSYKTIKFDEPIIYNTYLTRNVIY